LRNKIINGGFALNQRGGSSSTGGNFPAGVESQLTLDRWKMRWTQATTVDQIAFTPGQTDVPGNPDFYLQFRMPGSNNAGTPQVFQRVEYVKTFANQLAILTFYAKAPTANFTAQVFSIQNFGTGGAPSGSVTTNHGTALTLTTTWAKYTVECTIPSISGKTLGTNSNDYLQIGLQFSANVSVGIDIANVQFETGPTATPFESRPFPVELLLCQRFYHKSAPYNVTPATTSSTNVIRYVAATAAGEAAPMVYYPCEMRASPTLTFNAEGTGSIGKRRNLSAGTDEVMAGVNVFGPSRHGGGPGHTAGNIYGYHYTADAEL
jgi:hypothetical protein